LKNEDDRVEERYVEDFMRFTNDLDADRGQNIRTALPELFALWQNERGWRPTAAPQ
jgi:hypothetical protein